VASSLSTNPEATAQKPSDESRHRGDSGIPELVAILVTVFLADATIYRGHGYTGLAAFFIGALGLLYAGKKLRQIHRPLWIVGGLLTLLAAHLLWYGSPLQVVVGFVLVVAFATALDGQDPFLLAVLTMGSQAIGAGFRAFAEYTITLHRVSPRLQRPGILNIILPALAFLVFSALFVLANPDAVSFVGRQVEAFLTQASEWFIRMALRPTEPLFWMGVALVMAGLLRPISRLSSMPFFASAVADDKPAAAPLYSAFRNTLATAIGLFAIYLAYEFHTLWTRDFPEGFYYAGYAHEGAAWLTVALALATLILSVVFSGRVLNDPRLPRLRVLAWIWSLQNLLLSLSVYNRLFIYIDFNGMTRMRIVGLFGITVVVAGFLLVVWKIARGNDFPWLIHRQMWALAVAIYLFALTPVDGIAAFYNVRRILNGDLSASMQIGVHKLDLEGILALPPLLDSSTPEIRDGVAALIADRYLQLQIDHQRRQQAGWTAFQLSDQIALARFEAVRNKWKPYEDVTDRLAAIQRFYAFAYKWY
jgi:hypothetical protein